jgi:hypothetical protein
MAPGDTRTAPGINPASGSGVANLVSSITLSIPSSPEEKAWEIKGRESKAWAEAIHRRAFQSEIP